MRKSLTILWRGLLDLIVPPVCWLCEKSATDDGSLCLSCLRQLIDDTAPVCPRCASTLAAATASANVCPRCLTETCAFDAVVRLGPYDDIHRTVILRMKHAAGEVLAEAVAPLFARQLAPRLASYQAQLAVPIPLHWRRRLSRGYNQSEVLARALARSLQLRLVPGALRRVRNTALQSLRTAAQRRANVRGAFQAAAAIDLSGKTIILVDDVLTTGSTAHEAARVLKARGAKTVIVAVFAHETPRQGL